MASPSLQRLWKLHEVDSALVELRKRAASLDPGKKIIAEIKTLEAEDIDKGGEAKRLGGEQTDLELANKGIEDKIKRFSGDLYGGKIVNPREVENFEKEIATLKKQREKNDEKLLTLMEAAPPVQSVAKDIKARLETKKSELKDFQKRVMQEQERLKAEFARLSSARTGATQGIEPALMARYDAIRQKHGGIGMSKIAKTNRCEQCGMALPVKSIEFAKDGKIATCEACHRILYFLEGIV